MDVPLNPEADTGGFSLIYKQNIPDFRPYLGPCLFVFGKSITLVEHPRKRDKKKKNGWAKSQQQQQQQTQQQQRAWTAPPMIPRLREPKIVDFIDYLNTARCTAANWIFPSLPPMHSSDRLPDRGIWPREVAFSNFKWIKGTVNSATSIRGNVEQSF